ncbi:hypothetical protein EDB83DRAFT_2394895 [Lactarius deliciosus]|nr:hypothetical protein EDB83DRAFT_2394895 [Lactarius deliciosus]
MVVNFDPRTLPSDLDQPSPARFMIAAHDGAACALDMNANIRGCITTAGTDKMGTSRSTKMVRRALTLVAVGLKTKLQIWDVGANSVEAGRKLRERTTGGVIGVAEDEEDSDDEK